MTAFFLVDAFVKSRETLEKTENNLLQERGAPGEKVLSCNQSDLNEGRSIF
jgi:hypothetical protein